MRIAALVASIFLVGPTLAQDIVVSPLDGTIIEIPNQAAPVSVPVLDAPAATLRGLDKVSGEVREYQLRTGESFSIGRIEVALGACRYPEDNPTGEAYAWIEVQSEGEADRDFAGWMIASSPALSALDHPRYDVWVIRCNSV